MNILYTCDNNYIWIMGISIISLFENNRHIKDLTVYLLGDNISDENKDILKSIGDKYNRIIVVIDVPELDVPDILVSARWPLSAFIRLFSGQLLSPDLERIIYLDCDTIVRGNIDPLASTNIEDKIFYGIKDCIGSTYKHNIGLREDSAYINAGVLLINLKKLREINIRNMIDAYMIEYLNLINYADQDILNGVFWNEIGVLDPQYNVMTIDVVHSYREIQLLRKPTNFYTELELKAAVADPIIIHYTANMRVVRPWFSNTNHPLADEFKKYMEKSPWKNRQLSKMIFDSKETKMIGIIQRMPDEIAHRILGVLHAEFKPLYIRFKATRSFLVKRGQAK